MKELYITDNEAGQRLDKLLAKYLRLAGKGFLYKMIRCLMGTLEAAGSGKLSPEDVRAILEARDRTKAPETAPPNGLFLMKVFYTPEERASFRLEGVPFY